MRLLPHRPADHDVRLARIGRDRAQHVMRARAGDRTGRPEPRRHGERVEDLLGGVLPGLEPLLIEEAVAVVPVHAHQAFGGDDLPVVVAAPVERLQPHPGGRVAIGRRAEVQLRVRKAVLPHDRRRRVVRRRPPGDDPSEPADSRLVRRDREIAATQGATCLDEVVHGPAERRRGPGAPGHAGQIAAARASVGETVSTGGLHVRDPLEDVRAEAAAPRGADDLRPVRGHAPGGGELAVAGLREQISCEAAGGQAGRCSVDVGLYREGGGRRRRQLRGRVGLVVLRAGVRLDRAGRRHGNRLEVGPRERERARGDQPGSGGDSGQLERAQAVARGRRRGCELGHGSSERAAG